MTTKRQPFRLPSSIRARVLVTWWLVTLLTLGLYVGANLPQQRQDLLDALQSKAQGVSYSLQDITAGAAMTEDYSSVVDHATQVLSGDPAIEYLVITKADGFSVIVQRTGWRIETLDSFWRQSGNKAVADISYVPLAAKRVYHYSRPFDYSGIRWGWVNVGLSLTAHDESLKRIYWRSALMAVFALALSLLVSFYQARRLVGPIVSLQSVVRQVARGDLSARAQVASGDEVEELARSFNAMADTILDRNRILESVRFAGQQLLSADDWTGAVDSVLAKLGAAAGVSRVCLFENESDPGVDGSEERKTAACRRRFSWAAQGPSGIAAMGCAAVDWLPQHAARLIEGEVAVTRRQTEAGDEWTMVLAPIQVAGSWWGVLGLEEPGHTHDWEGAEKDSLRAVADMFGAAITRSRAAQALVEARDNLEMRVHERTRELLEEIQAKERVNAQLAEAQQRLMTLSRQAGMAEVATGVLHNVGNVLNSVNVSATIIANKIRDSRLANLLPLARMLEEHADNLPEFIGRDPKGQRVLPYLSKLGSYLIEERKTMNGELELLTGHIGHIKEIVATQQSYAKMSGLIEPVALPQLMEDAARIVQPGLEGCRIRLRIESEEGLPQVSVDKHLVLQILLNLLRNAKQAIRDYDRKEGDILVRVQRGGDSRVQVTVTDTGVGLPSENLTRIFSHGFTTRRDGHGFGLHSGANAARQMGGTLTAESPGPGLGATFTLVLPINAREATAKGGTKTS